MGWKWPSLCPRRWRRRLDPRDLARLPEDQKVLLEARLLSSANELDEPFVAPPWLLSGRSPGSMNRKLQKEYKYLRKEAKLSYAFEAYRGWFSRTLGIHHWLVGDYTPGVISLIGISIVLGSVILAHTNVIDKTHKQFCCCKRPHATPALKTPAR